MTASLGVEVTTSSKHWVQAHGTASVIGSGGHKVNPSKAAPKYCYLGNAYCNQAAKSRDQHEGIDFVTILICDSMFKRGPR